MKIPEYNRGWRDGVRFAVTWVHQRANEMNDPSAKAALNVAAVDLGRVGKENTIAVKLDAMECALSPNGQRGAKP